MSYLCNKRTFSILRFYLATLFFTLLVLLFFVAARCSLLWMSRRYALYSLSIPVWNNTLDMYVLILYGDIKHGTYMLITLVVY